MFIYKNDFGVDIPCNLIHLPSSCTDNARMHFKLIGKDPYENYQEYISVALKFYENENHKPHPVAACTKEDDIDELLAEKAYYEIEQKILDAGEDGIITFSDSEDHYLYGAIAKFSDKVVEIYAVSSCVHTGEGYRMIELTFEEFDNMYKLIHHITKEDEEREEMRREEENWREMKELYHRVCY